MAAEISRNRQMFWRITRRMLGAHRGRLFVVLLALGAGAAVTAALLNLQVDAKRRLSNEFRAFGANVVIAPREGVTGSPASATFDESLVLRAPKQSEGGRVVMTSMLYVLADAWTPEASKTSRVVLTGFGGDPLIEVAPFREISHAFAVQGPKPCDLGKDAAAQLHGQVLHGLKLRVSEQEGYCTVWNILEFGSPEDSQVFWNLDVVQSLAGLPNRVSAILLRVPGTPSQVNDYVANLRNQLPTVDVRPIRQITEGEAKIYARISGLLTATVIVVLVLTSLCVMAAMTNVAMERRNDVGLMKAIGGATRRVLRLFLVEAAVLGLAGGVFGAAAGILLSVWLGKQVFGVAAQPRLIVYPVAVVLTVIVAILSAFPLRRLASVRPASVLRGEA